jgi:dihydrofolate reductase
MRKMILSVNITLNGLMAGPAGEMDWHLEHWNNEMARESYQLLSRSGAIVVGRITYQALLAHWQQVAVSPLSTVDDRNYAKLICGLPKIVFSHTLHNTDRYRSSVARGSVRDELLALKQLPGKQIISWGGVNMAHSLIKANVVDVYLLWVTPVMLQKGIPLFMNGRPAMQLVRTRSFSNGVVLLWYQNLAPAISHTDKDQMNTKIKTT